LVVLGLELRVYTLSHSTSPFLWWVFLRLGLMNFSPSICKCKALSSNPSPILPPKKGKIHFDSWVQRARPMVTFVSGFVVRKSSQWWECRLQKIRRERRGPETKYNLHITAQWPTSHSRAPPPQVSRTFQNSTTSWWPKFQHASMLGDIAFSNHNSSFYLSVYVNVAPTGRPFLSPVAKVGTQLFHALCISFFSLARSLPDTLSGIWLKFPLSSSLPQSLLCFWLLHHLDFLLLPPLPFLVKVLLCCPGWPQTLGL
jgi:hypothetical protein